MKSRNEHDDSDIAIIGIACRFPGAKNWREFWNNLINGVESIRTLSEKELEELGTHEGMLKDKDYVNAISYLDDKENFDHAFFDYRPNEARLMNPQHRIFHECAWEAFEDAGYDPAGIKGSIGVFAGAGPDLNWQVYSLLSNSKQLVDGFTLSQINNKDFLASLLSYKLNLNGPSFAVNTACSTSLVAVHLACKSLLERDSSLALAGGISISTEKPKGYYYQEGMINSIDGHCRTFDKDATGTVIGEGVGIVVLKRLTDARKDKDYIYAIIKGSAINNDGKRKVGFTAPSIDGQVDCIKAAQETAKVDPSTISYIEAHGTGTKIGDPIEVEALNIAFNKPGSKYCAIGSVKSNIGHLDAAAGIAGLIKTALSLKFKKIPASLHYKEANPEIDFEGGPFYVNTELREWKQMDRVPLRAGVSSFGIGGTNAHVILEESPDKEKVHISNNNYNLLTISAKTRPSLNRYLEELRKFVDETPHLNLGDMCYTSQIGRKSFANRKHVVFSTKQELIDTIGHLHNADPEMTEGKKSIVFMFPGQGSQYAGMCKDIYDSESLFKAEMDKGFEILHKLTGLDFKTILFPTDETLTDINETKYAQPILFLLETALARLLMSFGITPQYMIGHSIGEYIAAHISGVFTFEEALRLVVKRGALMNSLPPGAMVSILSNSKEIDTNDHELSVAAINSPQQIVLSGETSHVDAFIAKLNAAGTPNIRLHTSHAFHSSMQDSILDRFAMEFDSISFNKPKIPFLSNLTGTFIKDEEAISSHYWTRHVRETVKFSSGIETLLNDHNDYIFIEVGPGHSLINCLKQYNVYGTQSKGVSMVRSTKEKINDKRYFTDRIGQLWTYGVELDWNAYYSNIDCKKITFPTYSFEPTKHLSEVDVQTMIQSNGLFPQRKQGNVTNWIYRPAWQQSVWLPGGFVQKNDNQSVIIFANPSNLVNVLQDKFILPVLVGAGKLYEIKNDRSFTINAANEEDFEKLFRHLKETGITPERIIHLWDFDCNGSLQSSSSDFDSQQELGYESLIRIVRTFTSLFGPKPLQLDVVANGWFNVFGNETLVPVKALSLGALKVIPKEFENISCRAIDLPDSTDLSVEQLVKELNYSDNAGEVAIRGSNRYCKILKKIDFEFPKEISVFRKNGTYLITGANGGMGKIFSKYFAEEFNANLILIGRGKRDDEFIDILEGYDSKIFYIQADVSESDRIKKGIEHARNIFGDINGIIHTAGIADFSGVILRRTIDDDRRVFLPKVKGTLLLSSIFENQKIDFFVNCSSLSATTAPFGEVAYVAANNFLDAFSESKYITNRMISIQWTALQEVGLAVKALKHLSPMQQDEELKFGTLPEEIIQLLACVVYLNIPTTLISTIDIKFYLQKINEKSAESEPNLAGGQISERPKLSTPFSKPKTKTEITLMTLVETFFGIRELGIDDNFFELGGDSLKAITLLKRIEKEFNVSLTLNTFFEKQNFRQIGEEIDEALWIRGNDEMEFSTIV